MTIFCQQKQNFNLWNVIHCVRVEIKQYKPRVHVYCVPKHYDGPWTNKLVAVYNLIQVFVTKVEEMHVILFYQMIYTSNQMIYYTIYKKESCKPLVQIC